MSLPNIQVSCLPDFINICQFLAVKSFQTDRQSDIVTFAFTILAVLCPRGIYVKLYNDTIRPYLGFQVSAYQTRKSVHWFSCENKQTDS